MQARAVTPLTRLAEYSAQVRFDELPPSVVEQLKVLLTDALGCLMGAYKTEVGAIVRVLASECDGGKAVIIGLPERTAPPLAAFIHATLINALDFDDTFQGHLSATVIPASLTASQLAGASGARLLESLVVGYEISARIGLSLKRSSERKLLHGHGSWQSLGAAGAAAKALGLTHDQTVHAMALAGSNAPIPSVMKTVYGDTGPTLAKNNFGTAALVGLLSAQLARQGFTGPTDILTGDTGFWRMIGSDRNDLAQLTNGLGEQYYTKEISLKPYSACRLMQTTLELCFELAASHQVRPDEIQAVRIATTELASRPPFARPHPSSMPAAQFSLPHCLAVGLLGYPPGPAWFTREALESPAVYALERRITITADPKAEADFQADHRNVPTTVEIVTPRGTLRGHAHIERGDPRRPLPYEEVSHKFQQLTQDYFTQGDRDDVLVSLQALEKLTTIDELLATLQRGRVNTPVHAVPT